MNPTESFLPRRRFLRVVGGGAIAAALPLSLAGCQGTMPPEAIAAWQGPAADEGDLRRWALSWAILAPHSHNLQSWLVDLSRPGEIGLRCDPSRLLPETDPFSRQIMMSHGTFLELLDLAARERGQRCEVELFPEGAFGPQRIDGRPVARIRLVADVGGARDPLFAQIPRRHTNRNAYDLARPVPASAWQALAEAGRTPGLRFGWVGPDSAGGAAALARHRAIAQEAWRIEMVTPRTIMESYRVLRIGAEEVARHRDGLTVIDPMVETLVKLGLFDRSRPPAPDSYATKQQLDEFQTKLASTPGFFWMVSEGNDRVTQVNAGRAYARVQLAATAAGLAVQPLQQALQEYPEQAGPHAAIRSLVDAPAPMHTVQMWARIGYAPAVSPAPRRGLAAQITAG
ncbi:MAG TPA: twin-arginine translocation pathway signal protein [Burkholderiaceae bacterium]|nr:twin-arginine translocation pathway signal protein [Burkholderiaceae bacterium]